MEIKKRYFLILVLLLMTVFCFCQDVGEPSSDDGVFYIDDTDFEKVMEEEGSFYIRTDDENNQTIVQEFKWEGSEDVFMYHFVIEKMNEEGIFEEYFEKDIETNFIDCTLGAGEYRYKIGLYNFLGIIELETDWVPVTVKKAIRPTIKSISPDYIYFDAGVDSSFSVRGTDIDENATFKIVNIDTGLTLPAVVMDKNLDRGSFTLQVDTMRLEVGRYTLIARNEGGFSFESKPIDFARSRIVDICISFGVGYPISMNSDLIENYWYWPLGFDGDNAPAINFSDPENPIVRNLTLNARFTLMPIKTKIGNFGFTLGVLPYLNLVYRNQDEGYSINSMLNSFYLCFNYQHMLGYKFVFDVHGGGGITLMDVELKYSTGTPVPTKVGGFCFTGGMTIQFFPRQHLYFELGCDYMFTYFPPRIQNPEGEDTNKGINMQYINPVLSLGWRF